MAATSQTSVVEGKWQVRTDRISESYFPRYKSPIQSMRAFYCCTMPDRDRGLTYLMQRGRIPDFAWKRIHAAMEILAADLSLPVH